MRDVSINVRILKTVTRDDGLSADSPSCCPWIRAISFRSGKLVGAAERSGHSKKTGDVVSETIDGFGARIDTVRHV